MFFNNSMEMWAFSSTLVETTIHWSFISSSNLILVGKLGIFVNLQQINISIVPSKILLKTCHKLFWILGNQVMGWFLKLQKMKGLKWSSLAFSYLNMNDASKLDESQRMLPFLPTPLVGETFPSFFNFFLSLENLPF